MLSAPPFAKTSIDVMRAVVFNPGIKENAGIFNHTQGWGVMAECMLGNGDRAYEYYRASMPAAYNDRAEIRQSEPYVQGQTTYSTFSPRAGNTRTSWLTGAAAWATSAPRSTSWASAPSWMGCASIPASRGIGRDLAPPGSSAAGYITSRFTTRSTSARG